jgi:hypothetical protein
VGDGVGTVDKDGSGDAFDWVEDDIVGRGSWRDLLGGFEKVFFRTGEKLRLCGCGWTAIHYHHYYLLYIFILFTTKNNASSVPPTLYIAQSRWVSILFAFLVSGFPSCLPYHQPECVLFIDAEYIILNICQFMSATENSVNE